MKRARKSSIINKTINELADVSTVHGLRYVLKTSSNKHAFDRIAWILIVVGATAIGIILSANTWIHWRDNPVVTTIGSASLPITSLDFPAVTICSPGNDIQGVYDLLPVILKEEWAPFWVNNNQGYSNLKDMPETMWPDIMTSFAMELLPGWPRNMTLERFLQHMTTVHPIFVKNMVT